MKKMLSALNSKSNHLLESVEQMWRETKELQSLDLILRNKHSSNPRDREFNPTISQTIRIEFPQFNGEDPSRRHYHAKVFFYSHQTPFSKSKSHPFMTHQCFKLRIPIGIWLGSTTGRKVYCYMTRKPTNFC